MLDIAYGCYLLLMDQAKVCFPKTSQFSPSPEVLIHRSTKTPKDVNPGIFPIRVGWYEWKNAVVPVLKDESVSPDSLINLTMDKYDYINIIRMQLISSYINIKALPDSFS